MHDLEYYCPRLVLMCPMQDDGFGNLCRIKDGFAHIAAMDFIDENLH